MRDAWVVMASHMASPPLYPYPQTTFVTAGPDGALQLVAAARTGRGRTQRPRGAPRGARARALGRVGATWGVAAVGVGARRGRGHPLWGEAPVTSLASVGYKFLRL